MANPLTKRVAESTTSRHRRMSNNVIFLSTKRAKSIASRESSKCVIHSGFPLNLAWRGVGGREKEMKKVEGRGETGDVCI